MRECECVESSCVCWLQLRLLAFSSSFFFPHRTAIMSIFIGTLLFVIIAAVGAFSAPLWAKSQVDLVRVLFYVSAFCCWLSWVLVYMAQMNPLLLPTRSIKAEWRAEKRRWGGGGKRDKKRENAEPSWEKKAGLSGLLKWWALYKNTACASMTLRFTCLFLIPRRNTLPFFFYCVVVYVALAVLLFSLFFSLSFMTS